MALLLAVAPDLLDGDAHRLFIIRSVGSARDRFGQRGQQLIGDALPLIADGGDDEGIPELFDTDMIADGQTGLFPEFRGEVIWKPRLTLRMTGRSAALLHLVKKTGNVLLSNTSSATAMPPTPCSTPGPPSPRWKTPSRSEPAAGGQRPSLA